MVILVNYRGLVLVTLELVQHNGYCHTAVIYDAALSNCYYLKSFIDIKKTHKIVYEKLIKIAELKNIVSTRPQSLTEMLIFCCHLQC